MSLTVTGTVVDENGTGLGGLLVEARGDWLLTSEVVDSTTTRNTGDFTLVLAGMLGEPTHPSSCRIRVVDDLGRPISDDKDVPGTDGNQAVGRITVRTADRTGLLVTNGKGEARMVSEGNAMTVLIDGKEAFGSAADDMEAATTSLNMTQLFFTTPDYKLDAGRREAEAGLLVRAADDRPARPAALRSGADAGPATEGPPAGTPGPRRGPPQGRRADPAQRAGRQLAGRSVLAAGPARGGRRSRDRGRLAGGRGHGRGRGAAPDLHRPGLHRSCSSRRTSRARRSTAGPTSRSYRPTWRRAWPTSRSPGATSSSAASSSRPRTTGCCTPRWSSPTASGPPSSDRPTPSGTSTTRGTRSTTRSAGTRRPTSSTTSASAWSARWSATCTRRSGRTGTRTRPRATRSRRCRPTRSPRRSPAGPTAWSRSRSSAPSAPAGSASSTGPARRASSRATCGRSARRSGSSTWRTSTSPTRSSPTPWPRSSRTSPGWS